ncbi:MAG: hypothetical protein U0798_11880 [Gemmataceae bacterium]
MTASRIGFGLLLSIWAVGTSTAQTPLFRSTPLPPPPGEARQSVTPMTASQVLAGDGDKAVSPMSTLQGPSLPPGSVESPWSGEVQAGGYNLPVGANGPITYELNGISGMSFPVLGGVLNNRLVMGWTVGFDGRTLFYNRNHDSAWVLSVGYSYIFNKGQNEVDNAMPIATPRQVQQTNPLTGQPVFDGNGNPVLVRSPIDGLANYTLNSMHRQYFNFGIGHDWWLNGPSTTGNEQSTNWRFSTEIGGRWGTGHVNLVPVNDPTNYLRKSGIIHAMYIGSGLGWERPFGNVVVYGGMNFQWTYNWMNLVPPQDGNLQDFNILFNGGIRF